MNRPQCLDSLPAGLLSEPSATPPSDSLPPLVGQADSKIEILKSQFDPPVHRKIAKLPKPLRIIINAMLDDGHSAREIIARLQASTDPPLPYPISENNISDWRTSGYRRYLAQQERLSLVQANREGAGEILANDDLTTLPEATLQIVANQYYELLVDFSPATLRQQLSEDPLKYTRILNVFARLVREIVHLRKFRDAAAQAAAAQKRLEEKDPDRDLSDPEFDLLVNKMDKVFKVARRPKPSSAPVSLRQEAQRETSLRLSAPSFEI